MKVLEGSHLVQIDMEGAASERPRHKCRVCSHMRGRLHCSGHSLRWRGTPAYERGLSMPNWDRGAPEGTQDHIGDPSCIVRIEGGAHQGDS